MAMAAGPVWAATPEAPPESGTITIVLDQAQVMRLPDGVATLVIGNPLIADVSIQAGGLVVLTGKGYGVTNLLALDRSGAVLAQKSIQVQGPRDNLVVYRGVEKESYSCAPNCERRITLGDSVPYFNAVLGQIGSRTTQAQGAVQSSK
ncbi:MAG: pilus assembly protein N-terminal domain-containing protein [Xanthobacteraceae bacterium]